MARNFIWVAIVGAIAAATFAVAPAAMADGKGQFDGVWLGHYGYDANMANVDFQAEMQSDGSSFSGATIENNTFADRSLALFLTASIEGGVDAHGTVRFVKTYDGTGGQTHSVDYQGVLDSAGRCVNGTWSIGASHGPFQMCATEQAVSKP